MTRPLGLSTKAESFTESVIREMTRLNLALNGPQRAINFAQGFPDFDPPPEIVEAAQKALADGYNQYATTWGAPQLRQAIAEKQSRTWGTAVDPETEVTVASMAAIIDSVAPQATVTSVSGSTAAPQERDCFSAMACRSWGAPQVVAYWL